MILDETSDPNKLLGTTSALEWAEEFCKRFRIIGESGVLSLNDSEGLMLAWFACSIETGRAVGKVAGIVQFEPFDDIWHCAEGCQGYAPHTDQCQPETVYRLRNQ